MPRKPAADRYIPALRSGHIVQRMQIDPIVVRSERNPGGVLRITRIWLNNLKKLVIQYEDDD